MRCGKTWFIAVIYMLYLLGIASLASGANNDAIDPDLRAALAKQRGGVFLVSSDRNALLPQEPILKTLKIKPGMTIVDIGAGVGTFTFPLADALQKTGTVYATEISMDDLGYIKKKVEERGYKNIVPVLVQRSGIDLFYKEHAFDIIFMCDILPFIWNMEDYFRELRPSLVKEMGRLYLIEPKAISDFHEVDFGDFKPLISALVFKGADFPVVKKLSPEARGFIAQWHNTDVPPEMMALIVRDLNVELSDRYLVGDLVDYFATKDAMRYEHSTWAEHLMNSIGFPQSEYVKFLIIELDDSSVFDKNNKELTDKDRGLLKKLNKMLILEMLHLEPVAHRLEQRSSDIIFRTKRSIITKMENAGYTLVNDYDVIPKYYFLEFKRSDSKSAQ